MDKDLSPEEKLLRLIKKRKPKKPEEEPAKSEEVESRTAEEPKEKIEDAGYMPQLPKGLPKFKDIVIINKILFGLFVITVIYFLLDYFFLTPAGITPVSTEELKIKESVQAEPIRHPYSYYEGQIRGRDLFKPLLKEQPLVKEAVEAELEDIIGNLSLLGVISGESPQAIIEDKKKRKTYFLNRGDRLGGIELKEILELEGKVTLIYRGKEFDLVM